MHAVDLEVLLDLLGSPSLVEKARAVFERGIVRGLLGEMEVGTAHAAAPSLSALSYLCLRYLVTYTCY